MAPRALKEEAQRRAKAVGRFPSAQEYVFIFSLVGFNGGLSLDIFLFVFQGTSANGGVAFHLELGQLALPLISVARGN